MLLKTVFSSALLLGLSLHAEPFHFPESEPPPAHELVNTGSLGVPSIAQKTQSWCWAASSEMVLDFARKPVSQCKLAGDIFYQNSQYCCQTPTPAGCVKGAWPKLEWYGVNYQKANGAVSWEQIKTDINRNAPLLASFRLASGVGHMVTVVGYGTGAQGQRLVEIINPCDHANQYGCVAKRHYVDYDRVYVPGLPPYNMHWVDYYGLN